MKLKNSSGAKNKRRIGALERLKQNILIYEKILEEAFQTIESIPIETKNIRDTIDRGIAEVNINSIPIKLKSAIKEIKILEERIVSPEVARASRSKKYRGA